MSSQQEAPLPSPYGAAQFNTTHWSVVLAAGQEDSTKAAEALEALCRTYWPPLYAYARRRGHSPEQAKDVTQSFFVQLLRRRSLGTVSKDRGKFRSFLLASMNHFLANEWDRTHREKRGGNAEVLSLDALTAEQRYQMEPADELTPEKCFERHWAQVVLEQVLSRLRAEAGLADKLRRFERLKPLLLGEEDAGSLQAAGVDLGLTGEAVKAAAHRMRQRFRQLLREEIAATVVESAEIDAEIRYLINCLRA
ncbi:MAG: sigma-70 family RNA polymerase sigma factor [Verrucomicrobiales bacterium]|nr:sigma-70 family RNA polymerase sigma factor [Verrucomicrobiales bacterium]